MIEDLCKKKETSELRAASTVNDLTDLCQKGVEAEKGIDVGELRGIPDPVACYCGARFEQTAAKTSGAHRRFRRNATL